MGSVAIIPARGGSKRLPSKNKRMFHGHPIIYYSIKAAQESKLFGKVIVSTDDDWIGRYAEGSGARWHRRPAHLADDLTGTQDVVKDVLQSELAGDDPWAYACCIYPTAPMIRVDDLKRGFSLLSNSTMNYAFSIGTEPLRDAGQWYWGVSSAFLYDWPIFDALTYIVPVPNERVCDINTEDDWHKAERMYAALHA